MTVETDLDDLETEARRFVDHFMKLNRPDGPPLPQKEYDKAVRAAVKAYRNLWAGKGRANDHAD